MNRNVTIVIVLIVVIIVAWAIWGTGGQDVDNGGTATTTNGGIATTSSGGNSTTTGANRIVVTYNGQTFSSPTTTVNRGDTVRFVNQSDGLMWVASDPHPTHTNYSAFDERASVGRGGFYEFAFDRSGTWGYHNHLNSTAKGTVIVR